jgi:hypothetical protein
MRGPHPAPLLTGIKNLLGGSTGTEPLAVPIVQLVKTTLDERLWSIAGAFCRAFDVKM